MIERSSRKSGGWVTNTKTWLGFIHFRRTVSYRTHAVHSWGVKVGPLWVAQAYPAARLDWTLRLGRSGRFEAVVKLYPKGV